MLPGAWSSGISRILIYMITDLGLAVNSKGAGSGGISLESYRSSSAPESELSRIRAYTFYINMNFS